MVPSSTLVVFTDGECFSCGGFSRGKIVHYGRLEVITNCFGGLSFSPKGSDSDAALVSSTGDGPSSPLWTMKEDSTEEFHMVLSGDEGSAPRPFSQKTQHGASASSRHNHPGHYGHNNGLTAGTSYAARCQPTFRVMARFLGGATSVSPRPATQHRA
jgi:hypothetical protein